MKITKWVEVGVVIEGRPVSIGGINPWDFNWQNVEHEPVELPHPAHPSQLHRMWVYQIRSGDKALTFAAGELSANMWGFYEPAAQLSIQPDSPASGASAD
jgi:hypothetical protein